MGSFLLFNCTFGEAIASVQARGLTKCAAGLRLRARKKPGTALAANNRMTVMTVIISTSAHVVRTNFVPVKLIHIPETANQVRWLQEIDCVLRIAHRRSQNEAEGTMSIAPGEALRDE